MSTAKRRTAHAKAILGPELYAQLPNTKVLLVGAGGIGCELLKNIVLVGFGKITLLDLDTIDLSNLNRQFLFRKKDVKQSKALIAAHTAGPFNPNVQLTPIHGNIKEPQYDVPWFQQFDIVLNALDNLDARRHVNKMCMAAQVPLVESGTAGYLGQVQPLLKDRTECFDCIPKPTPKSFPVCTIRSTPSQPIHCIVWSKSYLLSQLFGEDEDAGGELDEAEKQGEDAQEIATLRKEAQAFNAVRTALRSPSPSTNAAKLAFEKVFNADIKNLLVMSDMWRSRAPPVPLDFDAILDGSFVLRGEANGVPSTSTSNNSNNVNGQPNGVAVASLKDQRALSLRDNVLLFVDSTNRLAARLQSGKETTIAFDKDDEDTLDFVTAASNLRSAAYGIEGKTRWEVKEMAGNIIPAIATTNAIVSGLIVLQALHLLRKSYTTLRNVHLQYKPAVPLSTIKLSPPNEACGVCRDTYAVVLCDHSRTTLGEIVKGILGVGVKGQEVDGIVEDGGEDGEGEGMREVSVYEDKRVLSDPDWEDNFERTLESLNVTRGKFLSIVDEEGEYATIQVGLGALPPTHPPTAPPYILPSPLPSPPLKPKAPPAPPAPSTPPPKQSLKRALPVDMDSDFIDLAPTPKRVKVSGGVGGNEAGGNGKVQGTPSKRRKLEEEGLVLMDAADEVLGDEVADVDADFILID
ncbi:Ubiquitin-activating enzyme E1-like [Hypsizygus marmoreus]|uniref:Ubiquitin-activating enzyme E1-like n=1 Tax=Hypsizygus marmoreus TaxID=39966 RepID=A0A369KBB4_HYPMA|nr:Ubiquitin-activating enzyme E1-like [Hypsizygus marmoreus]